WRLLGAVSLVVLAPTLFFTFSRGAWLALGLGLLALLASSPRRLRVAAEGLAFALAPAAALVLAWRSGPLTHADATLAAATRAGHRLAVELLLLCLASALAVPAVRHLERRLRVGVAVRRLAGGAAAAAAVAGLAVALVSAGGPVAVASRAYHSFADPRPPSDHGDLTSRLVSLNGNGRARMWSVAVDALHGGRWVIGLGAGSFERTWDRSPRANEVVRDAHGLYVETLSELGLVGLALLVAALAVPLVAGLRRRAVSCVPALAGAYVAFLAHLAVDWDWELSGVALTGLFVGCLLVVARRDGGERAVRGRVRLAVAGVSLAAAAFAFVGLVGNTALARAQAASRAGRYPEAVAAAARARAWMPWSPAPLEALGTARLGEDDVAAARAAFRAAVALDPHDWEPWLDLAATVQGRARRRAVAHARALYPRSPEIAAFEREAREARARG
ncbi:MAG TPA: O-antigen ligase family protein, partial [Gaiellaceae bacterium]|nr:O-antigen ligase family protein [Gaiellaceae bacterium]